MDMGMDASQAAAQFDLPEVEIFRLSTRGDDNNDVTEGAEVGHRSIRRGGPLSASSPTLPSFRQRDSTTKDKAETVFERQQGHISRRRGWSASDLPETQNLADHLLTGDLVLQPHLLHRVEEIFSASLSEGGFGSGVTSYPSQNEHSVFAINGMPLIFKVTRNRAGGRSSSSASSETGSGDRNIFARRYRRRGEDWALTCMENYRKGKSALADFELNRLVLPKTTASPMYFQGSRYDLVASEGLTVDHSDLEAQRRYRKEPERFLEAIKQLVIFIIETGLSDVTWRNLPAVLEESGWAYRLAVVDFEHMQSGTVGIFGDPFTGRPGLMDMLTPEHQQVVRMTVFKHLEGDSRLSFYEELFRDWDEKTEGRAEKDQSSSGGSSASEGHDSTLR